MSYRIVVNNVKMRYRDKCIICRTTVRPLPTDNHWKDGMFCIGCREERNNNPKVRKAKARDAERRAKWEQEKLTQAAKD